MIGVAVVGKLLPGWAMIVFVIMLLSGLASSFDSGLVAGASLWAIDSVSLSEVENEVLRKERLGIPLTDKGELLAKEKLDKEAPRRSRQAMVGLTLLGLIVAFLVEYIPGFGLDKLWWVFNAIASMAVVPTILSLFWDKLSAKGILFGFIASFIGIIVFIIANAINNNNLIVISAVFIVLVSLVFNLAFPNKTPYTNKAPA